VHVLVGEVVKDCGLKSKPGCELRPLRRFIPYGAVGPLTTPAKRMRDWGMLMSSVQPYNETAQA